MRESVQKSVRENVRERVQAKSMKSVCGKVCKEVCKEVWDGSGHLVQARSFRKSVFFVFVFYNGFDVLLQKHKDNSMLFCAWPENRKNWSSSFTISEHAFFILSCCQTASGGPARPP